ncbi:MAG: efflux RND transporter periplasmic adaptor subunit [bacterium]
MALTAIATGIVILTLLSALTGCQRETPYQEAPPAVPVEVLVMTPESLRETTELTGVLEAYRAVDVVSEVAGETRAIRRDVGDLVTADDVLATLDKQVPRENLNQAEAALLAAEARFEMAFNDFQRDSTLWAGGDIAAAMYDNSRLVCQAARAEQRSAGAVRQLAARDLAETDIRAPFGGYVSRRYNELGGFVSPGVPVYRVVDIDSLKLPLGVSQHNVPRLQRNQPVIVVADALAGREFSGRIRSISPEADELTRTFRVEVILANPAGHPLRDGFVVSATLALSRPGGIDSDPAAQLLAVPREAVLYRGGEGFVFVVNGTEARRRTVGIGSLIDDRLVITRGLAAGERVVVVGMRNLRDGSVVRIEGEGDGTPATDLAPDGDSPATSAARGEESGS